MEWNYQDRLKDHQGHLGHHPPYYLACLLDHQDPSHPFAAVFLLVAILVAAGFAELVVADSTKSVATNSVLVVWMEFFWELIVDYYFKKEVAQHSLQWLELLLHQSVKNFHQI